MASFYAHSDHGSRRKLSGGMTVAAFLLLALLAVIFGYSLHMAATRKVHVIWIDPYVSLSVEGADGYGVAMETIDTEGFKKELEEVLRTSNAGLDEEEIRKLADETADSLYPVRNYEIADREDGSLSDGTQGTQDHENAASSGQTDGNGLLPARGMSNGDSVTMYVYVSDEMQEKLRAKGLHIAFECDPVSQTADGLPEAEPYDAFADLNVTFSGYSGAGQVSLAYWGSYPFVFSAEPEESLHNGDRVRVRISFDGEYENSLDRIVEDFHIMPVALEQEYTVSGLWLNPTSISDFTKENTEDLLEKATDMAGSLIEDEYMEGDRIDSLVPVSLYFAVPSEGNTAQGEEDAAQDEEYGAQAEENAERPEEHAEVSNYFYCIFLVNYTNYSGDELAYYYYVCYQDLKLDDQGNMIGDFSQAMHPEKPDSMVQELLGNGVVSLPGWRNMFRTVLGYESEDQLVSRVIDPLRPAYEVSTVELQ